MNAAPFLVPAGALIAGLAAGWALARYWRRGAAWALAAVLFAAAVALGIAGRQAQGFEGLGYAIAGLLMAVPASAGAALGGWLGKRP
ncbi:MAG: hypothetical protein JJT95_01745 [Pararhodobacter sp.]|nr:hypothetical protein [Pararhodobacter sp.]